MQETKKITVKGEVEKWARTANKFHGNRGSLGLLVEGVWHNLIGKLDDLVKAKEEFPPGTFVEFINEENKKGYLDIVEGSLKEIKKEEAYPEGREEKKPSTDRLDRDFVSCFMSATDFISKKFENSLRRGKPLSANELAKDTGDLTKQLYLDFQAAKEALKKEGKW